MIPVFGVILALTFGYLWWKYTATTLTRNCRWRLSRARGVWTCAHCGAETSDDGAAPKICLNDRP